MLENFFWSTMAYSLRYRKSRDTKGWDLTPAVFESHDDNYGYNSIYMVNETGYKKYRPRYYRMDILQSKAEIALLSFVTVLALATRTWMVNSIDTSVLVYTSLCVQFAIATTLIGLQVGRV